MPNPLGTHLNYNPSGRAGLTGAQAQALAAVEGLQSTTPFPYFSTVQLMAPRVNAAPGPYTYTIAAGTTPTAFTYAQGQNPGQSIPRLVAPGVATFAETNIQTPQQTISGEALEVYGISIQPKHGSIPSDGNFSDSRLLAQIDTNVSVALVMNNGKSTFQLGTVGMIPGGGGIYGWGYDELGTQPLDGGRPQFSSQANGNPQRGNAFRMPSGLIWRASGQVDSNLQIEFNVRRAIVLTSGGDPANPLADEAAAAGIRGYNFPAQIEANLLVYLHGRVISRVSRAGA